MLGPRKACTEGLIGGTVGCCENRNLLSRCSVKDVRCATVAVDSTGTSDYSGTRDGNSFTCAAGSVAFVSGPLPLADGSCRRVQLCAHPTDCPTTRRWC